MIMKGKKMTKHSGEFKAKVALAQVSHKALQVFEMTRCGYKRHYRNEKLL